MKKTIAFALAIIMMLTCVPAALADAVQYTRHDLNELYAAVDKYLRDNKSYLEANITPEEDDFCAKMILEAKKLVYSEERPPAESIHSAYLGLYNTYALTIMIRRRESDPSTALVEPLTAIILNDNFYTLVDTDKENELKAFVQDITYMIENKDNYEPDFFSQTMRRFFDELYSAARINISYYYRQLTSAIFKDVTAADWFFDAVNYVYGEGLFKGTGDSNFSPHMTMTRGMFVTVLSRFAYADTSGYPNAFTDIDKDEYYAGPIAWAKAMGIIDWADDYIFAPNEPVTREEMVTSMYNYSMTQGEDTAVDASMDITDLGMAGSWAREALVWAFSKGVISGYGDGSVRPKGTATRAEVSQVFWNFSLVMGE